MTAKKLRPASAAEAATVAIERPSEKELEAKGQIVLEETKPEPKKIAEIEQIERKEQVKKKPVMGQPKKYEEACKHVSFSLPLSAIENLKILSQFAGVNQTQFILSLINTEFEKNKVKVEAFRELMKK